jgi:hypothetical protein
MDYVPEKEYVLVTEDTKVMIAHKKWNVLKIALYLIKVFANQTEYASAQNTMKEMYWFI